MRELIGSCCVCGKQLYCLDGFFNGIYTENNKTICFDCSEEREKSAE
jgi:hypothetical protein